MTVAGHTGERPLDDGDERRRQSSWARRRLRLYAPLAAVVLAQALFVVIAPSEPEQVGFASAGPAGAGAPTSNTQPADGTTDGATDGSTGPTTDGSTDGSTGATTDGSTGSAGGDTSHCAGGLQQDVTSYSPPCAPAFAGENGGATAAGVTGDTITVVSFQNEFDPQVSAVLEPLGLSDDPATLRAFDEAAVEFLNTRYELYGRQINYVRYESACKETSHEVDSCRASVQAVIRTQPFAVIWPINLYPELIDDFARAGIIVIGGTGDPADRFLRARPFRYDPFMDGTRSVQAIANYWCTKLAGHNADHSGATIHPTIGTRGRVPRRLGVLVPNVEVFRANAAALVRAVSACGTTATMYQYDQDITRAVDSSNATVAALIQDKVTSVVCLCDIIAPSFLTTTMTAQRYFPEHVLPGVGSLDADKVARLYDPEQWSHAFGPSQLPAAQRIAETDAQRMWRSVGRTGDTCASCASIYWPYWSLLGLMIQQAGPTLNAATVEQGLLDAPPSGGWAATHRPELPLLSFGAEDLTGFDDAREVWWNPDATSAEDGQSGAYVATTGGERWTVGGFPSTFDVPVASR